MRTRRFSLILALLVLVSGLSPVAADSGSGAPTARVDEQVWTGVRNNPDRLTDFGVVMREPVPGDPGSAVPQQAALKPALTALQAAGSIAGYQIRYGVNEIMVRGSGSSVRFLADWPSVARIAAAPPLDAATAQPASVDQVAATGLISGKVTGPDGTTPLSGIKVTIYLQTGPTSWSVAGTPTTGTNGSYTLGSLSTGVYRAGFEDPAGNYAAEYYQDVTDWTYAKNFSVTDGQTTPNISASLARAGKISGALTISGGGGASDVVASAWIFSGGAWQVKASGLSSGGGAYTIGGLPPGAYKVRFSDVYTPPRYLTQYYPGVTDINAATSVTVVAGQTTAGINGLLGGYGKITGKVTAPDGASALSDITVDVYEFNTTTGAATWASYGTTDSSGNYEANGLETRNYRVEFSDSKGQYLGEFYNNKATLATADNVSGVLGGTVPGINASLALKTVAISRSVVSGWNLLSLPLDMGAPPTGNALQSLSPNYSLVQAYDACLPAGTQWKSYDPTLPPPVNPLQAVNNKQGLWVQLTTADALELGGVWPLSTSITLCPGWNLIGYPSITAKPVGTALASIAGKYNLVYGYDASDTADPWKKYNPTFPVGNDLTNLEPWRGYWIRMTQAATLVIAGR